MSLSDDLLELLEQDERERVIKLITEEWFQYPDEHPPETCVKVLSDYIITPLEEYIQSEYPKQHTGTEAATKFIESTNDIVHKYQEDLPVNPDLWQSYINIMDKHWTEFQQQVGWGAISAHGKTSIGHTLGGNLRGKQKHIEAKPTTEKIRKVAVKLLKNSPPITNKSAFARRINRELDKNEKKSNRQILNIVKDLLPSK